MIFVSLGQGAAVRFARLPGEGEVVHPGDAEPGVVDPVSSQAAVAEGLPGLQPGEDVLDAGPDQLVRPVVFLLPGWKFGLATLSAVRDDEPSAGILAVGDREGLADGGFGAGFFPGFAVVAVSGEWPNDHDDEAGVGVDDDLVVGGWWSIGSSSTARRSCGRGWAPGCRPR
jgi:hypothetical protein